MGGAITDRVVGEHLAPMTGAAQLVQAAVQNVAQLPVGDLADELERLRQPSRPPRTGVILLAAVNRGRRLGVAGWSRLIGAAKPSGTPWRSRCVRLVADGALVARTKAMECTHGARASR